MKNLRLLIKSLIILLSLSLIACMPKEEKSQIRIVDLQGKVRKVTTRYPELNVSALNSQGRAYERTAQGAFSNSIKVSSSPTYVKKSQSSKEVLLNQDIQKNQVENQDGANSVPQGLITESGINNGVATGKLDEVVEYDLGSAEVSEKPKKAVIKKKIVKKKVKEKKFIKKNSRKKKAVKSSRGGKYFVQVGSFLNKNSAQGVLAKMKKFHSGKVQKSSGPKVFYRVWLGPFSSKVKARSMVSKITSSGSAAILVKGK